MRFKQRLRRVVALATIMSALAAPAAWAAPVEELLPSSVGSGSHDDSRFTARAPAPAPVTISDDGFDWGDAGIGATAMLALTAIAAGAAVAVGRHPRSERTIA
jgi:hypothetical protein